MIVLVTQKKINTINKTIVLINFFSSKKRYICYKMINSHRKIAKKYVNSCSAGRLKM